MITFIYHIIVSILVKLLLKGGNRMDPKVLGQRIKEARLAKKMTQTEVVGSFITRNMLSQIESGNAVPSMKTLTYLAKVLELPPSVLLPDTADGAEASGDPGAAVSSTNLSSDATALYKAKEAYLAGDDTTAHDILSSMEESSVLFDEAQALFARVALRLATGFCNKENYSEALDLSKTAATAATKGLYASPEIKSQALLLLSDAAAKLAQI